MSGEPPSITAPIAVGWRARLDPAPALHRVRGSLVPITQIVVAVVVSFSVAHFGIGHAAPLLAATVPISSLGLVRDARPRLVLETVVGMLFGILVSELIVLVAGIGWWQLAIAMFVAMAIARFISPRPGFAIAAATQSAIVMILPITVPFTRLLDAAVGGAVALLVTALVPRSTRRTELADAQATFAGFTAAVDTVVAGLRAGSRERADRGLEKARALGGAISAWGAALESSAEIARISPFLRRQREEIARHARVQRAMDLAIRNLRVVARRSAYLVDDGMPRPLAADVLAEISTAAGLVRLALDDISYEPAARDVLRAVAGRLDPAALLPDAALGDHNLLASLRPLLVDLLVATGMPEADARGAIPRI
ncbi:FUSC family protein [Microbacterium sp. SCN 71-21]|uniref:FUSC family protein n=1 Tax=Microbacterium sp. SCN 71-21 TaxID=1660116 RepID=UPI000A5F351B|nr:FUSC family protein [Microbacterium sp. SCN 71-21]